MIILLHPRTTRPKNRRFPLSVLALAAVLEGKEEYAIVDGNVDPDPAATLDRIMREHGGASLLAVSVMPGPQLRTAIPLCREFRARYPRVPPERALFAARGLARVQALGELEAAWADAVGEPGRRQTRVEGLRRGVLSVTVAHPTLLEELASFQKPNLLASLRRAMGGTPILDIRFRVGTVDQPNPPTPPSARGGRGRK